MPSNLWIFGRNFEKHFIYLKLWRKSRHFAIYRASQRQSFFYVLSGYFLYSCSSNENTIAFFKGPSKYKGFVNSTKDLHSTLESVILVTFSVAFLRQTLLKPSYFLMLKVAWQNHSQKSKICCLLPTLMLFLISTTNVLHARVNIMTKSFAFNASSSSHNVILHVLFGFWLISLLPFYFLQINFGQVSAWRTLSKAVLRINLWKNKVDISDTFVKYFVLESSAHCSIEESF